MRISISIPDDLFEEAECLAAEMRISRSELYSLALQEFVAKYISDRLVAEMNRVVDEIGGEVDEFHRRASRRVLEQIDW